MILASLGPYAGIRVAFRSRTRYPANLSDGEPSSYPDALLLLVRHAIAKVSGLHGTLRTLMEIFITTRAFGSG